jgi:hypothetical protein
LTVDASGFNGNLTTSDNTLQEVAQKLDDLTVGVSPTNTASAGQIIEAISATESKWVTPAAGGGGGKSFTVITAGITGTPRYFPWNTFNNAGSGANDGNFRLAVPQTTFSKIFVYSAPGAGTNIVVGLVTNGVLSNLQVSINGTGSVQTVGATNAVTVAEGSSISVYMSHNQGSNLANTINVTVFE